MGAASTAALVTHYFVAHGYTRMIGPSATANHTDEFHTTHLRLPVLYYFRLPLGLEGFSLFFADAFTP
jgi:hypothetical protein